MLAQNGAKMELKRSSNELHMGAKSEREKELEKCEVKCSERRKTEPKWRPKGVLNPLKNNLKRCNTNTLFLIPKINFIRDFPYSPISHLVPFGKGTCSEGTQRKR